MSRDPARFNYLVAWLSLLYGPSVGPFLARRLAKAIRRASDECLSNFRACDLGVSAEVTRYDAERASGCCASMDIEVTHFASGRTFRLGFNYGH